MECVAVKNVWRYYVNCFLKQIFLL
ncbi:MAG TPA: DUF1563 domain-containing protein [Candidatus Lambdaproteobacteria bacterium]|uniref:Uncharacterized protein n=1 Tax=SAR324 cluster bacterium TaxID=2024889 RepID=A0A432G1F1_9DELT|nr:MAG: hypothetical protein DSY97_10095 [SAR324 cluster bacterium]HBJ48065.1 hypothetical protein [Deltaproteobacteria bacterium]HIA35089.1 DUF1563 domain-containing protein [Candidatus Lambdaproteobacteria bacterium]HIM44409.1 DUF1563 domain-containing protein [Deltaproteobacteria bacterium]